MVGKFECPNDPMSYVVWGFMPPEGAPKANSSWVMGPTKSSLKNPMSSHTIRTVTSPGMVQPGLHHEAWLGIGVQMRAFGGQSIAHWPGQARLKERPGSNFLWAHHPMSLVAGELKGPRKQPLALGAFPTSLGEKELKLVRRGWEIPTRYSRAHLHAHTGLCNPDP